MDLRFDRATLEAAFTALAERALADGKLVEIAVYGGSALTLVFDARLATKDVDAVFERDPEWVRRAARDLADTNGWDRDWLNDGVRGWLSANAEDAGWLTLFRAYPDETRIGLRVFLPRLEYIFAMKCIAMRIGGIDASQDIDDIKLVARALGLDSASAAMDLVQTFYPRHRIPARTQFGLEEIFDCLFASGDKTEEDTRE